MVNQQNVSFIFLLFENLSLTFVFILKFVMQVSFFLKEMQYQINIGQKETDFFHHNFCQMSEILIVKFFL